MTRPKTTVQTGFQSWGTALALVISILALFVSFYEANLLDTQQKALVWPHVTLGTNYDSQGFSIIAHNRGTGPALIKSMEVLFEGKPVKDYDDLLDHINPERSIGYDRLRMNPLNNTVMTAGEERLLFFMPWDEETRELVKRFSGAETRIAYCSVLDDCWIYDSKTDSHQEGTFQARREFDH